MEAPLLATTKSKVATDQVDFRKVSVVRTTALVLIGGLAMVYGTVRLIPISTSASTLIAFGASGTSDTDLVEKNSSCSCPPALAIWQCTQEQHDQLLEGIGCPYYNHSHAVDQQMFTCNCPPQEVLWRCNRDEHKALLKGVNCSYYKNLAESRSLEQRDVDVHRMYEAQITYAKCVTDYEDKRREAHASLTCCPRHWDLKWGVGPECRSCPEVSQGGLMCCPRVWKPTWGVGPICHECDNTHSAVDAKAACMPALLVAHKECVESVHAREANGENIAVGICKVLA